MRKDVSERNRLCKSKYNKTEWLGKKFGKLTVMGFVSTPYGWEWKCLCECGNEGVYSPYKLITGHTKTCGCGKVARCLENNEKYCTKHGGRHERLYNIWRGMKQRCFTVTNRDYPNWGGRGIKVCDEWRDDYSSFKEWSVANGYEEHLTIDRINNDGDYEPSNCRWITIQEQAKNRRKPRKIYNI